MFLFFGIFRFIGFENFFYIYVDEESKFVYKTINYIKV